VPTSPLLQTKLSVPRSRPGLVSRARLTERLNQAIEGRVTILSAPAGFGKTTLLTQWLAGAATGAPPSPVDHRPVDHRPRDEDARRAGDWALLAGRRDATVKGSVKKQLDELLQEVRSHGLAG